MGYGTKADKLPKAKSSDGSGERTGKLRNGVAMGCEDGTKERGAGGKDRGEFNTGRSESTCYNHKRGG